MSAFGDINTSMATAIAIAGEWRSLRKRAMPSDGTTAVDEPVERRPKRGLQLSRADSNFEVILISLGITQQRLPRLAPQPVILILRCF